MKKTALLIVLAMSFMAALAGDVIKVLKIYSGEKMVAIPVANIDSLNYTMFNEDGSLDSDYKTSLAWTIDSIYQIPIADIDSMKLGEIDVDQYKTNINQIIDYVSSQEGMELETFQNNLLDWLNEKDYIQDVAINDNKDFITITFTNGLSFFVNFQDIGFYEGYDQAEASSNKIKKATNENKYIDVSSQPDETIITKNKILYVEGYPMQYSKEEYINVSEYEQILTEKEKSPVNLEIVPEVYNPNFTEKGFDEYGMIFISQTHGVRDHFGCFVVEDREESLISYGIYGISIYVDFAEEMKKEISFLGKYLPLKVVSKSPKSIADKITDPNMIIFGNYCWSWGLTRYIKDNTIFGYVTQSSHPKNIKNLVEFSTNMFKGETYKDAIQNIIKPYSWYVLPFGYNDCLPKTNNPDSKQRYFSISINSVTKEPTTGNPVIKGEIKGFKNLKKTDIEYYVYVWGDDVEFNLEDITTKGKKLEIKDGTFNEDYSSPELASLDIADYNVVVAFTYGGKTYYSRKGLCPDDHHPHIIDLGLPSGTKWACCNVNEETSMQRPSNYGSYYAWGETKEKLLYSYYNYDNNNINCDIAGSNYDAAHYQWGESWVMPSIGQIGELINNCTSQWTTKDGIYGRIFTGPSGESIFLPAAGCNWFLLVSYRDIAGAYWSSTPSSSDKACGLSFNSELIYGDNENTGDRYIGLPVRPVWIGE